MSPVVWAPATVIVCEPSGTGLDLYPYASPILAAVITDVMSDGLPSLTKSASWAGNPCINFNNSSTVPGQTLPVSTSFPLSDYNSPQYVDEATVLN